MLSVVIPTYNRRETLEKAIAAYQRQTAGSEISEIIVVDDGSTDSTPALVQEINRHSTIPIRYLRQTNKGPAAARNLGIREAKGPIILFTDDDIIPAPDLVAQHVKYHKKHPDDAAAVLGFVTWSPDLQATPFMKWYGREVLFAYDQLSGCGEIDCRYFYTCNISLKKDFLQVNGMFDEEFKVAAFEDIELGFRLSAAGMRLLYNSQAVAYHEQFISFRDACKRHQKATSALAIFRRKEAGRQPGHALEGTSQRRMRLKRLLAPVLYPIQPLIDGRIPLPWGVYRTMFRIYR